MVGAKSFARKRCKIICMTDLRTKGTIVKAWREARGWSPARLADEVGTSRQNIENLEKDTVDQPRYLRQLALVMGYESTDELLTLKDPPPSTVEEGRAAYHFRLEKEVAHDLSYPKIDTPPKTPWEDVVSLDRMPVVPADLMVEVPDDALAARGVGKGQLIWFKAANSAQPRNVVLIEANGRRYIRRYAEDGQGPFAQALDDAYPSFREFTIVAVMYMRPSDSI